jgi:hypothetical protein
MSSRSTLPSGWIIPAVTHSDYDNLPWIVPVIDDVWKAPQHRCPDARTDCTVQSWVPFDDRDPLGERVEESFTKPGLSGFVPTYASSTSSRASGR